MEWDIVIPLGYGPERTRENERYWGRISSLCSMVHLYALIPCGGESRPISMPGISEAQAMMDYIGPRLNQKPVFTAPLENKSLTTLDNIKNVARILKEGQIIPRGGRILIVCNAGKKFVVWCLAWRYLKRKVYIETFDWDLGDSRLKQIFMNFYTPIAMYCPPLAALYRWNRKRYFASM